jgi:hypothetical protein
VRRRPLLLLLTLAALAALVALPSLAAADGDPPSDVLITNSLYTPVSQKISPPVLQELQTTIREANAGGFKVRVALVLDTTDLGAVPQMLGHPVKYVKLLASELVYAWKGAVVAVQPTGVAVQNVEPLAPAQTLADSVAVAQPASADALAEAANTTIQKLAAEKSTITFTADGSAGSSASSSSSTFSTSRILGGVLIVVLILLFVGQMVIRRRQRAKPGS